MRIRALGWSNVAVVWLCVLALVGSCWMVGCGGDKDKDKGNGDSGVKDQPKPAPAPETQPAKAATPGKKKGPGILERLGKKLTDGK